MTHRTVVLVLGALAVGVWVVILRAAWLADDAYITIRAVDNLVHGWGPRWNVAERVQVYTHPLWFWCLVPVFAAVGSARLTLLASCLVAAAGSLAWFARIP